jgi:hypothetical protein
MLFDRPEFAVQHIVQNQMLTWHNWQVGKLAGETAGFNVNLWLYTDYVSEVKLLCQVLI